MEISAAIGHALDEFDLVFDALDTVASGTTVSLCLPLANYNVTNNNQ